MFALFLLAATPDQGSLAATRRALASTFLGVDVDNIERYPACTAPDGADKICTYRDGDDYMIELRPHRPAFMAANISAPTLHGKIIVASCPTTGVEGQAEALDYLKLRYGAPYKIHASSVQNRFGAKFSIVHASWRTPTKATIEFDGATDGLAHGEIRFLR